MENKIEENWTEEETMLADQEIGNLISTWRDRDANPMAVCTLSLIRIGALAGQFFEGDKELFTEYLTATAESAMELYYFLEEGKEPYVH